MFFRTFYLKYSEKMYRSFHKTVKQHNCFQHQNFNKTSIWTCNMDMQLQACIRTCMYVFFYIGIRCSRTCGWGPAQCWECVTKSRSEKNTSGTDQWGAQRPYSANTRLPHKYELSNIVVKSSHLYLYSAFNITNCKKASAQYQNRKIVCQ